ncbi:hypothetical protein QCE81_30900 [Caballeronia sp. LZ002]|uniref:hypothetical protein n=2 Tax=unclassified Caballeronia TaxID=2646786 RepID=UPI002854FC9D|nr:hypothetical protein [Caballeronia sp. LZ002]MDR5776255.1 hypothetical protein [Caballeronia sp. LZ002]
MHYSVLGRIKKLWRSIWRSNHWFVTGTFSAFCAVITTLLTNAITGQHGDAPKSGENNEFHAGAVRLECRPQRGDLLLCQRYVGRDDNRVSSTDSNAASDHHPDKQSTTKP